MSLVIYGELTEDASQIVVMANGPEHEVAFAARHLELLTPAFKQSTPPGALVVPATWPVVVQLSRTFHQHWRTGPRLTAWLTGQLADRMSPVPTQLSFALPPGLIPRDYQIAGAHLIARLPSLIWDEPGPQPVTTPILTPTGWAKLGLLMPGDEVFDAQGQPATVDEIKYYGTQPVYRVTFSDRTSTLATADHRWLVLTKNDRHRGGVGRKLTTEALLDAGLKSSDGAARFFLPQQPEVYLRGPLPIGGLTPYAYGALLGDGSLGGTHLSIACPDDYVIDKVVRSVRRLKTTGKRNRPEDGRCQNYVFHRNGKLRVTLAELGALVGSGGKSVHPSYLMAHIGARRALLSGLLDTDGSVGRTGAGVEFSSASPQLARDVAFLARSLGAVVTESDPQPAGYRNGDGERVECLPKNRVLMRFPADGPNPFQLPRKARQWADAAAKVQRRNPPRAIVSIEPAGVAEVCCISMDREQEHERVYLTDTALIPTSNTGKTITAILGLRERHHAGEKTLPALVVAPASVVDSWVREIGKWAPHWKVLAWRGAPTARAGLIGNADVYVASYDIVRRDAAGTVLRDNPLMKLRPVTVIADEAHKIKNHHTAQSKAVVRVAKGAHFIPMSGTPITHHPADLWPALNALVPGAWPSRERWVSRYCLSIPADYGESILGLNPSVEDEFRTVLLGQSRRVAKADVLTQLPPKVYSVREVELPGQFRRAYDEFESQMLTELPEDGGELSVMDVLSKINFLQKMACGAADVEYEREMVVDKATGEEYEKIHTHVYPKLPSWKIDAMLELLEEREGQQTVVTSPSKRIIDLAGAAAAKAGWRVGYVVGGQNPRERTAAIDAFQGGELDQIYVTSGAGGVGITLTAASGLIFIQRPYAYVEASQMEDRCHRIGSEIHDSIDVIDIIAKNTIDTRIRSVLRERAGQLSDLVKDPRIAAEVLGGASVTKINSRRTA